MTTPEQLEDAKKINNLFIQDNTYKLDLLDLFLQNCVNNQLEHSVENNASMLADKDNFSPKEIEKMQKLNLEDLSYSEGYTDNRDMLSFKINFCPKRLTLSLKSTNSCLAPSPFIRSLITNLAMGFRN